MPKYAMIWTTSLSYMPGTNGILNALEFYGFPESIDRYVMVWEDAGFSDKHEYWSQWPSSVKPVPIGQSFFPSMEAGWYILFADIDLAIKLLDEYDVVLIWGADVCVVNDFSEYFDVCRKLDRMILGHNEQGIQSYNAMSKVEPYINTWDIPFADVPFFVPKSCKPILEDIMRMQATPGNTASKMDGLNYAVRDAGHKPFVVPGTLWVLNVTGSASVRMGNNQDLYFCNQRMNAFHRKYWAAGLCRTYMGANPTALHNHLVFNRMWNFLNRNCRVKWTEYLEEWDGKL
jgi:hypothetical protein